MISVKVTKPLTLRYQPSDTASMLQFGALAMETMCNRVVRFRNLSDGGVKAYSPRGPLYVPVCGAGGGGNKAARRGGYWLSKADVRRAGLKSARGRRTVKFTDYSGLWRAMGKSGTRNLELTGQMLSSIGIVRVT